MDGRSDLTQCDRLGLRGYSIQLGSSNAETPLSLAEVVFLSLVHIILGSSD